MRLPVSGSTDDDETEFSFVISVVSFIRLPVSGSTDDDAVYFCALRDPRAKHRLPLLHEE